MSESQIIKFINVCLHRVGDVEIFSFMLLSGGQNILAHPLTMYVTAKKLSLNEAISSIHTEFLKDNACLGSILELLRSG